MVTLDIYTHLPYNSLLKELGVLSIENIRRFADMVFAYRCLHGQLGITAPQVGLFTVSSNTRSDGIRLQQQRVSTEKCQAHFSVRVASQWNKLPCHITIAASHFPILSDCYLTILCHFKADNNGVHLTVAYEFYHVACFIALVFYVLTVMCRPSYFSRYFVGVILRPQWDF